MLDEYNKYITIDKTRKFYTEKEAAEYLNRSVLPFSAYLEKELVKRNYEGHLLCCGKGDLLCSPEALY